MKSLRFAASVCALSVVLASCSGYDQLLKSEDFTLKYEKAREYYNKGAYSRALPLFKQLLAVEKGTDREEQLMYYIAYSHYGQEDYLIAAALFKNYYTYFPRTNRSAECHYMSAYCNYLASPKASLDQSVTYKAIESFQLFVNAHPTSDSVEAANRMIDLMRRKLEGKAMSSADLYFKTRNYQAAAVAYENLLVNFPDIPQSEYVQFLVLQSYYEFAQQSTTCKQPERYDKALSTYKKFADRYPQSEFSDQAGSISEKSTERKEASLSACREQERAKAFFAAESRFRNKEFEKSARLFENYRDTYTERDDLDQIQLNIIRSHYRLGEEAETACTALPHFDRAMEAYYYFADRFAGSKGLEQAEKLYDNILTAQDQSKKNCHELH